MKLAFSFVFLLMAVAPSFAEIRFAPPEFESGYTLPTTQNPAARWLFMEYFDVAVLIGALGLATWIVYRKRSRNWIVGLGIFSLLYFGFYREGCVCAIGSVQNVSLGLFNNGYAVPLIVLAFFAVPLVATLFFGRTFCAAVCPHGALQDLILLRPVNVPVWLERGLGLIPFAYLGLAVIFAATGSLFIICEYDPFIPIFRLTGSTTALALAAGFLITGVFVGRPYCRFLCPYGALLRMASSVAKWRVRITPSTCTQCSLCAETCPFGVIRLPSKLAATPRVTPMTRRRLAWLLVALPLLIAAGGLAGGQFAKAAARVNPNVRLHENHLALKAGKPLPDDKAEQIALERADATAAEIEAAAESARRKFAIGGWFFGGWVGLAIAVKLLSLSAGSRRTDFEPERSGCYACARCFSSCPQELVRVGLSPVAK